MLIKPEKATKRAKKLFELWLGSSLCVKRKRKNRKNRLWQSKIVCDIVILAFVQKRLVFCLVENIEIVVQIESENRIDREDQAIRKDARS